MEKTKQNQAKEQEKLLDYLANNTAIQYYDALNRLHENYVNEYKKEKKDTKKLEKMTRQEIVEDYISSFLANYGIDEQDLKEYKEQNNDFWNDKDKDGRYWCDISQEQADSSISIYNYTLWQEAPILSEYIEEALKEFDFDKKRGIIGLFQMGQYQFYSGFYNDILTNLKKYCDEEMSD